MQKVLKAILIWLLRFVKTGQPYGTKFYNALARVTVNVSIEAAAIRRNQLGSIEIYLERRAQSDSAYPKEWHIPGTIMRPGESVNDMVNRLSQNEFGTSIKLVAYVDSFNNTKEARGHFFSSVYIVDAKGAIEDKEHGWFELDKLPPLIWHHESVYIPWVVKKFLEMEGESK